MYAVGILHISNNNTYKYRPVHTTIHASSRPSTDYFWVDLLACITIHTNAYWPVLAMVSGTCDIRRRLAVALLPLLYWNNIPGHTTRAPQVGFITGDGCILFIYQYFHHVPLLPLLWPQYIPMQINQIQIQANTHNFVFNTCNCTWRHRHQHSQTARPTSTILAVCAISILVYLCLRGLCTSQAVQVRPATSKSTASSW